MIGVQMLDYQHDGTEISVFPRDKFYEGKGHEDARYYFSRRGVFFTYRNEEPAPYGNVNSEIRTDLIYEITAIENGYRKSSREDNPRSDGKFGQWLF